MQQEQLENRSQLDLHYKRIKVERKRIESDSEIEEKRIDRAFELLNKGLDNGRMGSYAAFGTFAGVFILSFSAYLKYDKTFMSSQEVLLAGVILCATLITYYGFIFGYTLFLTASFKEKLIKFGTEKVSKETDSAK